MVSVLCAAACSGDEPGGPPDGGAMQPDGFTPLDDCPGVPLSQDGTLDVDLKSIHVTGAVTLNGTALPTTTGSRGEIVFRERYTQSTARVDLQNSGPGRIDVYLAPGQYDVLFAGNAALCQSATNAMPCSGGVLKKSVMLTASGAIDLDLQSAVVQGRVTVNGAAIPASYIGSAGLSFRTPEKDSLSFVPSTSGIYRVVLLKNTYTIAARGQMGCDAMNPLPCVAGTLTPSTSIQNDGVVDIDIKTIKVTGSILVNSQAVSTANSGLGAVIFQLTGGGTAATKNLAAYQLTLLPGTYDLSYQPIANDCTAGVPCVGGSIKKALAIQSSGVVDVDIPAVTVQGNVTINSQPIVAANERGTLLFVGAEKDSVSTLATGPRQLATYKVVLLRGVYDVAYAWGAADCGPALAKGPCMNGTLKSQVSLSASGTLDVDIPSITVTGKITLKGAAVTGTALMGGRLSFMGAAGERASTLGLGNYSVRLLPGSYDVGYEYLGATCPMTETLPCASGTLLPAQKLMSNGVLDVDIPLLVVTGKVTLNGMPLPTITPTRGSLEFSLKTATFATPSFGSSGAVSYRALLLPGAYKLVHRSDFSTCASNTGTVPCVDQVLAGCR